MRRMLLAPLVLAALGLLSLPLRPLHADPAPGGTAVVDMLRLIESYPSYATAKQRLEQAKTEADNELKLANEDVKGLIARYQAESNKDTPQARALQKSIEQKQVQAKFQYEWAGRVAQEEYGRNLSAIYGKVKSMVAAYARTNRIPLVLQMTAEELKSGSRDEFVSNVVVRGVVFHDTALDITDAVIKTFPAPAAAPSRPPAPPPGPAPAVAPGR